MKQPGNKEVEEAGTNNGLERPKKGTKNVHELSAIRVEKGRAALHWFGQSSFGIKDDSGTVVMVDPYFPHERPAERFIHPEPPVDEAQVRTDWVLLTHDHRDHTCIESARRIRAAWPEATFVGPKESVEHLAREGFPQERLREIAAGESVALGSMTVHAVYAKPPGGDPKAGIAPPDVTHLGYVVVTSGPRIYISGDPINTFAEHETLIAPVRALEPDVALLTTHPSEGEFPYFEGSAATARAIGVRWAVPAHYQCFVKRNYDPAEWARHFRTGDPEPVIIAYNTMVTFPLT